MRGRPTHAAGCRTAFAAAGTQTASNSFTPDCILLPVTASIGAYQRLMRVCAIWGGGIAGHIWRTIGLRAGEGGFNRNEPGASNLPCATPFQLRDNSFYNFIKRFGRRYICPVCRPNAGLHVVYGRDIPLSPIRDECRPVVTRIFVGPDLGLKFTNAACCSTRQVVTYEYDVFHADKHGVEAFERAQKLLAGKN